MAPLRSLSNPISSFNDPFAGTGTRAGEVWFPPPPVNRGTRAVFSGGSTYPASPNGTNTMDFITITGATGHANDFGDLVSAPNRSGSASNGTRGICCGGYDNNAGSPSNIIQYYTFATTGNATDSGNLTAISSSGCAASNGTRAVNSNYTSSGNETKIDYFSFASNENATDFGDLYNGDDWMGSVQDLTRALFCGGDTAPSPYARSNVIQYITVATTGDSQDFGDLTVRRSSVGGVSNNSRGVIGGGNQYGTGPAPSSMFSNVIDYVTIANTGNATDFGDLTEARNYMSTSGASGEGGRGAWGGGHPGSSSGYGYTNTIDYVTIANTGNATDYGDLSVARGMTSAATGT